MRGAKPGERRGGRRQGTPNRATTKNKATLSELAQIHTPTALATLAAIMNDKDAPAAARVAASNAILDRAYGKPRQEHDLAGEHGPIVVVIREFAFSEDSDGPDFANANAGNALQ